VSGALAELEHQFEIKLFDRIGKRLRLSGFGAALRARAQALHEQARELELAFAQQNDVGVLRVGATLTIGNFLTVPLMASFMNANPGAQVQLEVANTEEIARKVANFEIDVGLVEGELRDADLEVSAWCDDELVVFCAPSHPLAAKREWDDDDLRQVQWIVRERGSGTRQAFEFAMHGILPELRIALELQHVEGIKSAVEAGLGVGCVSRIAVSEAFRHGQLTEVAVPGRSFRRQFFFIVHKQKHRGPGIQRWLELCRKHAPQRTAAATNSDASLPLGRK
jgi:DNA-binding transcriptional LysR family regulator